MAKPQEMKKKSEELKWRYEKTAAITHVLSRILLFILLKMMKFDEI